jgi:hypothetical protein
MAGTRADRGASTNEGAGTSESASATTTNEPASETPSSSDSDSDSDSRMELIKAAEKEDWERAKVRRPLEAVSSTECGPS